SGTSAVRIFVYTIAGGLTARISEPGAGATESLHTFPTWTSASQVAFVSDEGGAHQVYVQSANGADGTGRLILPSAAQPWVRPCSRLRLLPCGDQLGDLPDLDGLLAPGLVHRVLDHRVAEGAGHGDGAAARALVLPHLARLLAVRRVRVGDGVVLGVR